MPQTHDEGTIVVDTKLRCCKSCHAKVYKAISDQPDVDSFNIDLTSSRVTLKAPKADPKKVFEGLQKKSGGKITRLVHPDPTQAKKEEPKQPKEVTVELKINLDCHSCIDKVVKATWKLKEVHSVKVVDHQTLAVRGWDLDPKKICKEISKKSKKHAEIVPPKKDNSNSVGNAKKEDANAKKEEAPTVITQYVYAYPPQYYYSNEYDNTQKVVLQSTYSNPPQYFSDENPNACVLM